MKSSSSVVATGLNRVPVFSGKKSGFGKALALGMGAFSTLAGLLPSGTVRAEDAFVKSAEPQSVQVSPEKPQPVSETPVDETEDVFLQKALAQQKTLLDLHAQLKAQGETLAMVQKRLATLSNAHSYEAFAQRKQEAIKRVQSAQFILVERLKSKDEKTGQMVDSMGSSAGWIARDRNGKLALLGCCHGVKESIVANAASEFEIIFDTFSFKVPLAQNMPKGLKAYSEYLDIAYLAPPNNEEILEKLAKRAIPLSDIMAMDLPAGSEAVAIGSPLDTKRFANEGILAYYDVDGRQVNWSQTSVYPRLLTDAGTNPGNSGGPLIAYNWKMDEWQIVGATNSKQDKSYQGAMCTPMSAFLAFLSERGFETVDTHTPEAVSRMAEILDHDHGFSVKHKQMLNFYLDEVYKDLKVDLNGWLAKNKLTRAQYLEQLEPRMAKIAALPRYNANTSLWECLKIDEKLQHHYLGSQFKEMVTHAVQNQLQ